MAHVSKVIHQLYYSAQGTATPSATATKRRTNKGSTFTSTRTQSHGEQDATVHKVHHGTAKELPPSLLFSFAKALIRLSAAGSALVTLLILPQMANRGLHLGFGNGTQYLTIIGLFLTLVTFTTALLGDLTRMAALDRLRNVLVMVVVPVEIAVTILYWGLTAVDITLIYETNERYLPFWLDIQMHGLPSLFLVIELMYLSTSYRVQLKRDLIIVNFVAICCSSWFTLCAYMDGDRWPYPILERNKNTIYRIGIMLGGNLVGIVAQIITAKAHMALYPQRYKA